jgi:DNA-binding beta-propeller fold protein YncE
MDRQMRDLLDAAVGEPPHQVSVEAIRRRVIRRRVMEYVATGAALAVTAAAVLAGIGALGGPGRSAAASTAVPTVYVCNVEGTVTPVRIATNTAGKPIRVGFLAVTAIAITPDGKTAYVAEGWGSSGTVPPMATVIPIATATNTAGKPIKVGTF